jgi:hypothetical protein
MEARTIGRIPLPRLPASAKTPRRRRQKNNTYTFFFSFRTPARGKTCVFKRIFRFPGVQTAVAFRPHSDNVLRLAPYAAHDLAL